MPENEFQDIHDALGIQPTDGELDQLAPSSGVLSEMQSAPNKIAGGLWSGVSNALGINDAVRAATGDMSPEEQKMFALTGALGLLPGARAESLLAKGGTALGRMLSETPEAYPNLVRGAAQVALKGDVPELWPNAKAPGGFSQGEWFADAPQNWKLAGGTFAKPDPLSEPALKQVYEDAWSKGEAPFSALADHVEANGGKGAGVGAGVYNLVSPGTVADWKDELEAKYGDWAMMPEPEGEDREGPLSAKTSGPDYAEHFEPLDWSAHSTHPNAFADLPQQWRDQGESLGFNFDAPLYKGGRSDYPSQMPDVEAKRYERGLFATPNRAIAMAYGPTTPYVARAKNAMQVDWKKATGYSGYGNQMHDLVEAAKEQGVDLLAVNNIRDIGSDKPHTQYVVLDPSILRAPHANFDPSKLDKAWPLAGVAGLSAPIFMQGEPPKEESQ